MNNEYRISTCSEAGRNGIVNNVLHLSVSDAAADHRVDFVNYIVLGGSTLRVQLRVDIYGPTGDRCVRFRHLSFLWDDDCRLRDIVRARVRTIERVSSTLYIGYYELGQE